MTLILNDLSNTLSTSVRNTDFSQVEAQATAALESFNASAKTILGSAVGEIRGGIEALTQEIDDAEDANIVNQVPTVARVTEGVPIANNLVGQVGAAAADIQALTGSINAGVNGYLNEIVSAASPDAMNAALSSVTNLSTQQLSSTLENLTSSDLIPAVENAVQNIPYRQFQTEVNKFVTELNDTIKANSRLFLVDLGEKLEKNYENSIRSIFGSNVTRNDIEDTFALVANGDYDEAFDQIAPYIDVPDNYARTVRRQPRSTWSPEIIDANARISDAESRFKVLSVELSSYSSSQLPSTSVAGNNSLGAYQVGSNNSDNYDFSDIQSLDELEAMFRNVNRRSGEEITGAIIHWSATFLDQNIGAEWINDIHINKGFSGIGYHIVIRRDGSLQRARPLNRRGAHDVNNNKNFLGFCFVGGINEYSSNARQPYWRYASSESLTPSQFNTYDGLMRTFHNVFPYAQVQGHYATSNEGKADPGFDVPGYSLSKFGHRNVIEENDPRWKSSTPIDLAAIRSAGATS